MKFACELVVIDILPAVRRDLAKELILRHNMRQKDVAKLFGVTNAAICQYMKGLRGRSELIEDGEFGARFKKEICISADLLNSGKSDIIKELCRLCALAKASGILDDISDDDPYIKCTECPNRGHEVANGGLLTDTCW